MMKKQKSKKSKSALAASIFTIFILLFLSFFLFYFVYRHGVKNAQIATDSPPMGKVFPPKDGVYLGISLYDPNYADLLKLEKKMQKRFAIVGMYQAWGSKNNQFNQELMGKIAEHNSTPLITWEPWVQVSGYDRSEEKVDQEKYRLKNITEGKFDVYITNYAIAVKKYKKQVMIRFAHEMNGNWYPWGSAFNSPSDYIEAWQHVHDIFNNKGATNVTWIWSPNEIYTNDRVPYADQITEFYPGDEYVDWVGFSAFNWAGRYKKNLWRTPDDIYSPTVKVLTYLKKPVMITETASAEGGSISKKAKWINDLVKYIKANQSIKGVIWFNAIDNGIDWRIDSSTSSSNAYKNSVDDYFIQSAK